MCPPDPLNYWGGPGPGGRAASVGGGPRFLFLLFCTRGRANALPDGSRRPSAGGSIWSIASKSVTEKWSKYVSRIQLCSLPGSARDGQAGWKRDGAVPKPLPGNIFAASQFLALFGGSGQTSHQRLCCQGISCIDQMASRDWKWLHTHVSDTIATKFPPQTHDPKPSN